MDKLIENVKKIVDEKGLKYNWLADKVGVSKATMSKYMHNYTKVPLDVAIKIADTLGVSLEDLTK